jgi:hypothetical protein
MTSDRAQAYGRVVDTLGDLGPSKLLPEEQALIRESVDALFFCEDLSQDEDAGRALEACRDLGRRLVSSERWLEETARELVAAIEQCGPLAPTPSAAWG